MVNNGSSGRTPLGKRTCPELAEGGQAHLCLRDLENSRNLANSPETRASFFARDQGLTCDSRRRASEKSGKDSA